MNSDPRRADRRAAPGTDGVTPARPAPLRPASQVAARLVLAGLLVLLGLWVVHAFLPALAWAAVLAIATWPLFRRFAGLLPGWRRPVIAALLFTLLIGALLIAPLAYGAVEAAREVHFVVEWVATVQRSGVAAPPWLANLPIVGARAAAWWQDNLADPAAASLLFGQLDTRLLVEWTRMLGFQLAHRAAVLGFTLLTLFFLYYHGMGLAAQLRTLNRRVLGAQGERLAAGVVSAVQGTLDGLVLVGLGEGLVLGVVYAIAEVPHPALFGAATAILAIIPFGAPLMFGIAALILLANGATSAAIAVFVAGLIVVFIADHFIRPVLIGGAVRLPFLWVLVGILGGLESLGLLGVFLGPAVMAALISLWREWTGAELTEKKTR